MKTRILALFLLFSAPTFGQRAEMQTYDGLLYSPEDLRELRLTADSLQLVYRQCELKNDFSSWPQARVYGIDLRYRGDPDTLLQYLHRGVTVEEVRARFGYAFTRPVDWQTLVRKEIRNVNGEMQEYFLSVKTGMIREISINQEFREAWQNVRKGQWAYSIYEQTNKNDNVIHAFRLEEDFTSLPIPERYARLIQYVDCMVDTTTELMLTDRNLIPVKGTLRGQFDEWLVRTYGRKAVIGTMDTLTRDRIWKDARHREALIAKTDQVVKEAIKTGSSSYQLEFFMEKGGDPAQVLLLKRSRRVVGYCSYDTSPRSHGRDIAVWAARAHDWPSFIRSHLNIMNDAFERMAYSYMGQLRFGTYLRELEALGMPSADLLIGSIFRVQGTARLHYMGASTRIGRAFVETKDRDLFENTVLEMLKDAELDDYNRTMLWMALSEYCLAQTQPIYARTLTHRLLRELTQFPEFLQKPVKDLVHEIHNYGILKDL